MIRIVDLSDQLEEINSKSNTESDDEDKVQNKSKEDMDRVIAELTSALVQTRGVSALRNHAVTKNNNHNHHDKLNPSRKNDKSQNIKYPAPDPAVNYTKVQNKRHLSLIETNVSDGQHQRKSDIELRLKPYVDFYKGRDSHSRENIYSIRNTELCNGSCGQVSGSWHLTKKFEPLSFSSHTGKLDYKNFNYNYGIFLAEELHKSHTFSQRKLKNRKKRLCIRFCKIFCFLILLFSFVLVIVCVSVFVVRDK